MNADYSLILDNGPRQFWVVRMPEMRPAVRGTDRIVNADPPKPSTSNASAKVAERKPALKDDIRNSG